MAIRVSDLLSAPNWQLFADGTLRQCPGIAPAPPAPTHLLTRSMIERERIPGVLSRESFENFRSGFSWRFSLMAFLVPAIFVYAWLDAVFGVPAVESLKTSAGFGVFGAFMFTVERGGRRRRLRARLGGDGSRLDASALPR